MAMTTTVSKKETIADDNVASINLDAITHSPFATRGFVRDRNHPYIAHVSAQKQLDSCPPAASSFSTERGRPDDRA